MSKLIILRGNSGSGLSDVAELLQVKFGRNTMVISKEDVRYKMLWVSDGENSEAIPLLKQLLKYGSENSETTILEGDMFTGYYSSVFDYAEQVFDKVFAFYFELSFNEALRRLKCESDEVDEDTLKKNWKDRDYLNRFSEYIVYGNLSLTKAADSIYNRVINLELNAITENTSYDNIIFEYVNHFFNQKSVDINSENLPYILNAQAYARIIFDKLKRCRMTVELSVMAARMYMMCEHRLVGVLFVLDKKNRICYTLDFVRNYQAPLADFVMEIKNICKLRKSNKCIVAYNYNFHKTFGDEVGELNLLYHELWREGVDLKDVIKIVEGKAISVISLYENIVY